jgi:hypothetical protein
MWGEQLLQKRNRFLGRVAKPFLSLRTNGRYISPKALHTLAGTFVCVHLETQGAI